MKNGRPARASAAALAALALMAATTGCRKSAPAGQMKANFGISHSLESVSSLSFDIQLWLLQPTPSMFYENKATQTFVSEPCLAPNGPALNQITVRATIQFAGDPQTYTAIGSTVFTCTADADVSVQVPLDVLQVAGSGAGGADVGITIGGSQCSSSATLQGDSWLGVCPTSSCDGSGAVFNFSNTCAGLDGTAPTYWTCGVPADWSLVGTVARAQLQLPNRDGTWPLGLLAFPQQVLATPDPTLSDAAGDRRVFGPVATPRSLWTVAGGVAAQPQLDASRVADHAALLDVPASATAAAQLVLEVDDAASGTTAVVWNQFGACDVPAAGIASWPGLHVIDVRLQGLSSAVVLLSPDVGGAASAQVICNTALDANQSAIIVCGAPGALGVSP